MSVQLTTEQLQTLGIEHYAPTEREAFVAKIGGLVFDASIMRLMDTLNEDQMYAFTHAIESYDSFDATLAHIQKTYPVFNTMLQEEQHSFMQKFVSRIQAQGV
ncbi:MAG: hypothetical protein ACI9H6_000732 [Patiriisocius sp.]|jgi:hypothetical protein